MTNAEIIVNLATIIADQRLEISELKTEVEHLHHELLAMRVEADTPQTDCGDFADRLAYERGVKHAWEVAQKVFDSTVTFYEAEDVAKRIDKDRNVRGKTEQSDAHRFVDDDGDVWEYRDKGWHKVQTDYPRK